MEKEGFMHADLEDVEFVTETAVTIRGSRRRTTVPKRIADRFTIADGERLRWVLLRDGTVLLSKVPAGVAERGSER